MTFRVVAAGHMPGGEPMMNVWHFAGSATGTPDVDDALDALSTFYDTIGSQLSSRWGIDEFRVSQPDGPVLRVDTVEGLIGEGSSIPMPNDVAVLVHWRTINPARTGRGKTFLAGILAGSGEAPTSSSASIVGSSLAGTIAGAAGNLSDAGSPELQIYSRVTETGYNVTGGYVSRRWATQRRRDRDTLEVPVPFTGAP